MRVVFMGTPSFAVPSLRALAEHHQVVAVFTRPDAASGRGRTLRPSPVKETALELGLRIEQPSSLRNPEAQDTLAQLRPDLIAVAAYGLILPREVLDIPAHGCINVHASLLPRWRGAAPVQRAILAGDEVTGVSIMQMEEGLDTGPYCLTATVAVGNKNATQLTEELGQAGAEVLIAALLLMQDGGCEWTVQDEAAATYAPKVTKEDVSLSPELSADEAALRVRASSAQAPSRVRVAGRTLTITGAEMAASFVGQGMVGLANDGPLLGLLNGSLRLIRVKPEGKGEMSAGDWARGARLAGGETWESIR